MKNNNLIFKNYLLVAVIAMFFSACGKRTPLKKEGPDKRFFSVVVKPINSFEKGILTGNYMSVLKFDEVTPKELQYAGNMEKRVYFIPVTGIVRVGEEAEFLAKFGKKPIKNVSNYLLGAMATQECQENNLPEQFKNKNFIAVPTKENELFTYVGYKCFLRCLREEGGRGLFLEETSGNHLWIENKDIILAEDI